MCHAAGAGLIVDQLSYRGTVGARPDVREVGAHDQCQPPLVSLRAREERVSKRHDDEQRVDRSGCKARRARREARLHCRWPAPRGRPTARPRAAVTWLRCWWRRRRAPRLRREEPGSPGWSRAPQGGSRGAERNFGGAGRFGVEPGSAAEPGSTPKRPAPPLRSPAPPRGAGLPCEGSRPKFLGEPVALAEAVADPPESAGATCGLLGLFLG